MVRLAACQYAITPFTSWEDYEAHLWALCTEAADQGAQLLLLPEYAGMTLAALLPEDQRSDLQRSIAAIQPLLPRWQALSDAIARGLGVHFCPGSAPVRDLDGRYRNRAFLYGPGGFVGYQDKIIMTRFERETWFISAGTDGLRCFETSLGRLGILICYDTEFPMFGRRLAEMGCSLILVPSCTDTEAGHFRVSIGARARALENQLAVLVSATAGMAPWSPAVDENFGRAALYVPADYGMPSNGICAESDMVFTDRSQWLYSDIDLDRVERLRRDGQVMLYRDWPEQFTS